jgi:YNFM family putative membrane transporter
VFSLFAASLLSLAASVLPGWHAFLFMRFLTGIALAGIPAVAMAYVAEEVDAASIGAAMGLYIAGSAIAGMAGRLGLSLVADIIGWRYALACMNLLSLIGACIFYRVAPHSRSFVARRHSWGSMSGSLRRLAKDAALPWLYAEGFLLMGVFITIYNYAGFHLREAPYHLGQAAVGSIFLLYILGSYSASWFGKLADRRGRRTVFWTPIIALLLGCLLTLLSPLPLIVAGIGIVTIGFFGAHSIASSWVGRRAQMDRAQGSALYLFFYYLGSSVLGSIGGFVWSHAAWPGIVGFTGVLSIFALLIAARLASIPPLPART